MRAAKSERGGKCYPLLLTSADNNFLTAKLLPKILFEASSSAIFFQFFQFLLPNCWSRFPSI